MSLSCAVEHIWDSCGFSKVSPAKKVVKMLKKLKSDATALGVQEKARGMELGFGMFHKHILILMFCRCLQA